MTAEKYRYSSRRPAGWRNGYAVDEVAVMRACSGERLELTAAERGEAVRRLERDGLPLNEIARRLDVCWRTVQRHRSKSLVVRSLTERQRQVLARRARGMSYTEIADDLSLSKSTVTTHMFHAAATLGARNHVHAVALAIRRGLI